jgi:hypothetical protein
MAERRDKEGIVTAGRVLSTDKEEREGLSQYAHKLFPDSPKSKRWSKEETKCIVVEILPHRTLPEDKMPSIRQHVLL